MLLTYAHVPEPRSYSDCLGEALTQSGQADTTENRAQLALLDQGWILCLEPELGPGAWSAQPPGEQVWSGSEELTNPRGQLYLFRSQG